MRRIFLYLYLLKSARGQSSTFSYEKTFLITNPSATKWETLLSILWNFCISRPQNERRCYWAVEVGIEERRKTWRVWWSGKVRRQLRGLPRAFHLEPQVSEIAAHQVMGVVTREQGWGKQIKSKWGGTCSGQDPTKYSSFASSEKRAKNDSVRIVKSRGDMSNSVGY